MQFTHLLAFGFDCLLKLHNAVLALMGGELTHPRTGFEITFVNVARRSCSRCTSRSRNPRTGAMQWRPVHRARNLGTPLRDRSFRFLDGELAGDIFLGLH